MLRNSPIYEVKVTFTEQDLLNAFSSKKALDSFIKSKQDEVSRAILMQIYIGYENKVRLD